MFALFAAFARCDTWAVIFCGSNQYYNYRHTADSYYMYYLLNHINNVPEENIILMCYDDIVDSASNPFKGQIFRSLDHVNVYPGKDKIAYTGKQVTAKNFYNVLLGDTSAGPALKSTSNDNLMVFYDNHGGSGIFGVPEGCGAYIYANDLKKVFEQMYEKGMYKNCFFPITACYAGSVALVLEGVPKLYLMTAAHDKESSYADIWDPALRQYLTSEFSTISQLYWQAHPYDTLGSSLKPITDGVKKSHVTEYGDKSIKELQICEFFGKPRNAEQPRVLPKPFSLFQAKETEARMKSAEYKAASNTLSAQLEAAMEMNLEKQASAKVDAVIEGLRQKFQPTENAVHEIKDWDCYKQVLGHMQKSFNYLGESFYAKTFFFSNLCNQFKAEEIIAEINKLI
jgi:legumain